MQHLPQVLSHLQQLQKLTLGLVKTGEFFTTPDTSPALAHLTPLTSLHIESDVLDYLPTPISLLTNLRSLTLSSTSILRFGVLVATPSHTLKTLIIKCDRLSNLSNIIPESLPQLQSLTLQTKHLSHLPEYFFPALTALTFLDLDCSALQTLPPGLCRLSHLASFSINSDAIEHLPPHDFAQLTKLRKLNICSDTLKNIPPSTFFCSSLTSLEFLSCNHPSFYQLPRNFGLLSNLQVLRLSGAWLLTLPEEGWEELRSLRCLSISGRELTSLPKAIWQMQKLKLVRIKCSNYQELEKQQEPWTWSLDTEVMWVPWIHEQWCPDHY
jgi:Leucine-rich repeat (LRR) protein